MSSLIPVSTKSVEAPAVLREQARREVAEGYERAVAILMADPAHNAHEGPSALAGEDAQGAWAFCGMQESAALLDLIGWSTRDEADRLSARRREAA